MFGEPPSREAVEARQAEIVLAAAEAMEATLSVAEALVAERRRIDLTGLEDEIGRLCAAALAAPRVAAPALRVRFEAMVRSLDRLRAGLGPP